jgi:hypothetical protein
VLAVIDHLPRTFDFALASLTPRAFVAEVSLDSVRGVYGMAAFIASLSQPRDLSGRDDNALSDRLGFTLQ